MRKSKSRQRFDEDQENRDYNKSSITGHQSMLQLKETMQIRENIDLEKIDRLKAMNKEMKVF